MGDPILEDVPTDLIGTRVQVRPFAESDVMPLLDAVNESREHLVTWLPWFARYRTPQDVLFLVRRFGAMWLMRQELQAGIFSRPGGAVLGGVALNRIDWGTRVFEVGYWIARQHEGNGFVTEAVQLVVGMSFDHLAANRVAIRTDPRNLRSCRVAE